ncbi:MAG TPA: hypothetical protein VMW49_07820 [Candidatus Dormibacteraeota bacterium]|nr:hypothetical protein [Candidatus Dormibacteraeota bacterium]
MLQFRIERHGPTAQGSTRAEVQSWTVDVDAGTAAATAVGRRQLRPMARQLDVRPLADHVANLIVRDVDDPGLRWSGNRRRVTVRIGEVIPDHGPKETVQGRRRRFREALETALAKERWTPDPSCFNTYRF